MDGVQPEVLSIKRHMMCGNTLFWYNITTEGIPIISSPSTWKLLKLMDTCCDRTRCNNKEGRRSIRLKIILCTCRVLEQKRQQQAERGKHLTTKTRCDSSHVQDKETTVGLFQQHHKHTDAELLQTFQIWIIHESGGSWRPNSNHTHISEQNVQMDWHFY